MNVLQLHVRVFQFINVNCLQFATKKNNNKKLKKRKHIPQNVFMQSCCVDAKRKEKFEVK